MVILDLACDFFFFIFRFAKDKPELAKNLTKLGMDEDAVRELLGKPKRKRYQQHFFYCQHSAQDTLCTSDNDLSPPKKKALFFGGGGKFFWIVFMNF